VIFFVMMLLYFLFVAIGGVAVEPSVVCIAPGTALDIGATGTGGNHVCDWQNSTWHRQRPMYWHGVEMENKGMDQTGKHSSNNPTFFKDGRGHFNEAVVPMLACHRPVQCQVRGRGVGCFFFLLQWGKMAQQRKTTPDAAGVNGAECAFAGDFSVKDNRSASRGEGWVKW